MSQILVSLGNSRYENGRRRLVSSCYRYNQEFCTFSDESEVGAPNHFLNPYAFKVYTIRKLWEEGYTKIIWVDCSVFLIKPLDDLWKILDEQGFLAQEAGYWLGQWCNDTTLNYFGITREEANGIQMYGNAGLLGINFDFPKSKEFFLRWEKAMEDGMFKGSWSDHRHDMSCGSYIRHALDLPLQPGNEILQYGYQEPENDTICFKAVGIN